MTRLERGILELLALLVGIILILVAPDAALTLEVIALPVVVVIALLAAFYLRRVYFFQPEPRSRFFGMVVDSSFRKVVFGAWIAYLVIGRIGDRTGWYFLPTPPPNVSSPISGLAVLVFVSPPIVYAFNVWMVRRGSGARTDAANVTDLDRD